VPEAPPEETGSAVDVAKDLVSDLVSDLVIDLATSPLGRGAEWRKQRVPRKGAQELATITVRANPQMALLAASDLLDTIVRCVDDSGPEPGRYQLVLDTLKDHRRVTMRGGTALGRCVLAYDVDSAGGDSLWRQMDAPQATFVLVLETTEAPPMQKIFPGKKAPKLEHDKKPGGKQR